MSHASHKRTDTEDENDNTRSTNKALGKPITMRIIDDSIVTIQTRKRILRQHLQSGTSQSADSDISDKENDVYYQPS